MILLWVLTGYGTRPSERAVREAKLALCWLQRIGSAEAHREMSLGLWVETREAGLAQEPALPVICDLAGPCVAAC